MSQTSQTRKLEARDGTKLHSELWEPQGEVSFVVCIVHGQSEHVSRYDQIAAELNELGGLVFGADHRGEGRSGGIPGHAVRFEQYADDLLDVLRDYQAHLGEARGPDRVPWFIWAHSMGGLIALTYLLDHEQDVQLRGAVISAPLLKVAIEVGPVKELLVRALAKLFPRMAVPVAIDPNTICRDPEQVQRYDLDPRRTRKVTTGWVIAMEAASERVQQEAQKLTLPMHWYVGTGDQIVNSSVTQQTFAGLSQAQARDQSIEVWPGYFHELHNEPTELRAPVIAKVHAWIRDRLPTAN
ncbi:alpha/beta hydrolase [Enhygromyxa salina]|uniref:Phospholipase YtpA n=1 Tax=Enhygromyxa salina TaxID=215803 RepID=A0A2S9YJ41_9BACT|nr:alpha/beta hydrolase [Enhygromyxa salina]PRQ05114.1 Phospholipase YtpA [Enhygromyxa salina]